MLEGKHSLGVGEIDRVHFSGLFHYYFIVVGTKCRSIGWILLRFGGLC